MRVGFAGTPAFAAAALQAIADAGHTVPVVLSQPDRPHGRGLKLQASPVKQLAAMLAIPVAQPASLKRPEDRAALLGLPLDVLVVAAYGLILPPEVLAWPRHGALNIHASRLPRWRGAAPIQRAIEAGDVSTGITIMQMDRGLDTGPVVQAVDIAIDSRETAGSLHDKLMAAGAALIVDVLGRLEREGSLAAAPQPEAGATYAQKIEAADARIDWRRPARVLDRKIRALDPVPGALALWQGTEVKIWSAEIVPRDQAAPAGTVLAVGGRGIDVACGDAVEDGALRITSMQPAAGRRMPATAFVAGRPVSPGMIFA